MFEAAALTCLLAPGGTHDVSPYALADAFLRVCDRVTGRLTAVRSTSSVGLGCIPWPYELRSRYEGRDEDERASTGTTAYSSVGSVDSASSRETNLSHGC